MTFSAHPDHAEYAIELYSTTDAQPVSRAVRHAMDISDGRLSDRDFPPRLLVDILAQRHIIKGIAMTGLKA